MQFVYLRGLQRQAWIKPRPWLLYRPWLVPELLCSSSLGVIWDEDSGRGLAEILRDGSLPAGSSSQHGGG